MLTPDDLIALASIVAYLRKNDVAILRETSEGTLTKFFLKVPDCDGAKHLTVNRGFLRALTPKQIEEYMEAGDYASKLRQNGDQHLVLYPPSP